MTKKLFTLLLAVAASVGTMLAWDYKYVQIGDLYYNLDATNQTAEVTYKSYNHNIYNEGWGITTANIPASVEYNSVTYSVTSIGDYAFDGCTGLTSVTIGNGVSSIGKSAFRDCTGLTAVHISDLNAWCKIQFPQSYSSPLYYAHNLYLNGELVTDLVVPEGITTLGDRCFYGCTHLISATIPDGVTSIGANYFADCTGLTSVTIGSGLTSMAKEVFMNCSALTFITCEAVTPPTLGSNVFSSVNTSIPLYVPAESVALYKAADQWKDFTNILEETPGTCITASSTCGAQGGNLTWKLSCDSILTISGTGEMANYSNVSSVPWYSYNSSIQYVVIGNSVTSIGESAFAGCRGLTSVTIPNSVTSIGDQAFFYCTGLTSVTISNGVTSIGENAFYGCSGLTSVTIPNSVTSIGEAAFFGCTGLTSIIVESGNMVYDSRNNCSAIIETATNTLITGCQSTIIPNSVTSIGKMAFYDCDGLTSIDIPNSVTSIGDYAFLGCTGLKSVTIPNSVTSIGESAFEWCTGLTSITCEAVTPPTLNSSVFGGVDKSIPLYVPAESVALYKAADQWKDFTNILPIGETPGTCITASGTCGAQGDNLTWELSCDSILTISGTGEMANYSNVSSVPWYSYNSSIQYVVIGNSVTSIGELAFNNCTGLTSLTIPNSVTSIGNYAFMWCTGLKSVTIPNSVTRIGDEAFYYCSGLTSVTIPNSVTSIGDGAFYECSGLTSVTIPNSVTSIGRDAFDGCTGLKSVTIPNSVTSIGERAFAYCDGLTSVTIGNSVTSIGESAFWDCTGLTSVTCFATRPPQLDIYVFEGVDKSIPLYVPAGSVSAYQSADQWKDFTDILPIGAQPVDVTTTTVTPSETTANIAWPQVTGAATYTIEIKKNGELICTLTFNAQGQLISIAFNAPSRNNAPQQAQAAGFSFTVTSLDSGTTYSYTMTAKGNNGNVLKTESGTFTTTGDAQGVEEVLSNQVPSTKILRNGQIFILRGDKTYTTDGRLVR